MIGIITNSPCHIALSHIICIKKKNKKWDPKLRLAYNVTNDCLIIEMHAKNIIEHHKILL